MLKPLNEMSNEELWELFPIVLAEHDPAWSERYAAEAELPDSAAAYAALKRVLYSSLKFDRDGYTEGKTAFVREATVLARTAYGPKYGQPGG